MVIKRNATLDDLANASGDGTYELIDGRLVQIAPTGEEPGQRASTILFHLMLYERETGRGRAYRNNVGFAVDLPRRQSFSPDAAYAYQPLTGSDDFIAGAPAFAAEVRSKGDYGPGKDANYAAKRAEYFAAGTLVGWDVNPHDRTITAYRADAPDAPRLFAMGDSADVEPVLPGWRVPVAELFRP